MSSFPPEPEGPITSSIERLRHELDRWLDVARTNSERALGSVGFFGAGRSWSPTIDISESGEQVRVVVDLPGVSADAVELTLVGNMLTLSGQKLPLITAAGDVVHVRERQAGNFRRAVPLPVAVDPESVSAEAKDGVLIVRLAKAERDKPRQIKISRGPESTVPCLTPATPTDIISTTPPDVPL